VEDRDEMPGRVLAACLLVARGLPVLAVLFVAAMLGVVSGTCRGAVENADLAEAGRILSGATECSRV